MSVSRDEAARETNGAAADVHILQGAQNPPDGPAAEVVAAGAQPGPARANGEAPGGPGPVPARRDEDAVNRARTGISEWVGRAGRTVLHLTPHGIITAMTAAALAPIFIPLLIANPASAVVAGALAQLGNVGAEHLARVLQGAVERLRGEAKAGPVSEETLRVVIERTLTAELAGPGAVALSGEMARVLHEINGIGAAFEAAVFSEVDGLRTHISQAVDRLSGESALEFGRLRVDVRDAVVRIQGNISQVQAIQKGQTEKLDLLLMELAIIHREVSVARPAPAPRAGAAAEPGALREPGGADGAADAESPSAEGEGGQAEPELDVRPYPGLAAFGETDAFWFHGRERLTAELVIRLRERLHKPAPLIVMGASGAGKSSVLRAGLIPELTAGGLAEPGSPGWPRVLMTPGSYPLRSLAMRLALLAELPEQSVIDELSADPGRAPLIIRHALLTARERRERGVVSTRPVLTPPPSAAPAASPGPGTGTARGPVRRLVLMIDQFEEVFTLASGDERRQFIDAVCAAAGSANGSAEPTALVVLGLRGGFVDHCTAHPALSPALRDPLTVGPMDVAELHDAIETPARDAGLAVEAGLAAAMLSDLEAVESPGRSGLTYDPGKLPLLAYALQETWARRSDGRLTVAAYDEAGGIKQAIAKKAEQVYARFDPYTARVARRLLEHMVSVREDAEDTRRRMTRAALLDELSAADAEAAGRVLDTLEAERLVTADQDMVQIAHEALLRHWPRLAGWLRESRARIPVLHQLTERAREWDRHQRHPDMLLHGAELSAIDKHVNDKDLHSVVGAREAAFVTASKRRQTRNQRVRELFVAALIAALVGVGVFAGIAQRNSTLARRSSTLAQHQQAVAEARALAARADGLRATNPQASLLLSLEAYRVDPGEEEAISSLLSAQSGYFTARLASPSGPVNAVAWNPDGTRLAGAGQDGAVTIWDVPNQRPLTELRGSSAPSSAFYTVAIDPRGRFVAAGGTSGGTVLWDLATGRTVAQFPGDGDAVDTVAFSPDGSLLAAAGDDGAIRLWRTDTLAPAGEIPIGHGSISSVAFSPDGRLLAAACFDESVRLFDLAGTNASNAPAAVLQARFGGYSGAVRSVAFSPDATLLATGSDDGTVRLWDVRKGESRGVFTGTGASVRSVAFSPDGTQLASGGEDNAVRLWDVGTRSQLATLDGPANTVAGVAFSPDGRTLAGADDDATIGLWNVAAPPQAGDTAVAEVADSGHGGGTLATSGTGGRVGVWNPQHPVRETTALDLAAGKPAGGPPIGIAVSPDGRTLAAAGGDRVALWDVATARADGGLDAGAPVTAVAYGTLPRSGARGGAGCVSGSPGGRGGADVVAAASPDYAVYLWDWTDRQADPTVTSKQFGPINAVAISDDGCLLAAASDDGTVMLTRLSVAGGRVTSTYLGQLSGHLGPVEAVAFSPDGRLLASGSYDGTVILWNVSTPTHTQIAATLPAVGGAVTGVAFSGDGGMLASSANDHTIRLWSLGARRAVAAPSTATATVPVTATATLNGPANATGVVFEPGGKTVAAAAADGTALFWNTNAESLADQICESKPADTQQMLAPYLAGIAYRPVCP